MAKQDALGSLLETLARRIARNREIAGFHYPTDSQAGFDLARKVFAILKADAKMQAPPPGAPAGTPSAAASMFRVAMDAATAEWTS